VSGQLAWNVPVGEETTSVVFEPADRPDAPVFVCAHGAGGNMNDGAVRAITSAVRARGIGTVRFNLLYAELGRKRPDPMPRVIECLEAVVSDVRAKVAPKRLILGGRSMGGRGFSMAVADGLACDGLLLLAYPLHPPGQPTKLRVEHLGRIGVPVLCMNGTRDPFCTPELMEQTLATLGDNWTMEWLAEADHSFHVLKRTGRTNAQVIDEAADAIASWVNP
jgi:predicted alpha/beta-hydrolase family hydrolase